ncbi:hypothetical protein [Rufibacter hautae]|uniref:Uncharacterized protein n=1 Tax=Rufibacter hautae TaxID=2595005 RepID=A0A5B6TLH1_9BACT|nr:hypothetical protein [Rufibacter hautae]KAA3440237.1 hypothetical protein FOA19_06140 [Rufibacter hautae]
MKKTKWMASGLLSMVFSLFMLTAQAAGISPTEQKLDKILNTYATKMKAAFLEKNDQKTIALIKSASDEAGAEMHKLKPELEKWAQDHKGLKGAEKEAFEKRFQAKPYFKTIFEVMLNPAVAQRLQANPALDKAIKEGNKAFPNFKNAEDSNLEESSESDEG